MNAELIQNVRVVVTCPACGAEDYEIDFDGNDIASACEVSIPCDECPKRISVSIDVSVQAVAR